jgi:hypothetical protein
MSHSCRKPCAMFRYIIGQHIGKSWALIQYVQCYGHLVMYRPKQVNAGGVPLKSPPPKQKYPASCHLEKEEARSFPTQCPSLCFCLYFSR